MRFDEFKEDLVLDYTANQENLFPDGDLFNPKIIAYGKESVKSEIQCPDCHSVNSVTLRPNPDGYNVDQFGYFLDLVGERGRYEGQHFPAHFSRRCSHVKLKDIMFSSDCSYFWSSKNAWNVGIRMI